MGLGDMAKKAKDALSSEKGEEVSDQVLDKGADLANRATGGKYADKIERGRDAVDERVGTEGTLGSEATDTTITDADTGSTTTDATTADPDGSAGRHRGDGEPDAGGSGAPGERRHRA